MNNHYVKTFIFGLRNLTILGLGISISLFLLSYLHPLIKGYNPKIKDYSQTLSFPYSELANGGYVLLCLLMLLLALTLAVTTIMNLGSLSVPPEEDV